MTINLGDQVTHILQRDQPRIDLDQFLFDTPNDQYDVSSDVFVPDTFDCLPQPLLSLLKNHHHPPLLGLLPDIHRVWLATGSRIYFWDYINKTLFTYEAKDTVVQVGLVKSKPGILDPSIEYVLVVNTTYMITVTGILTTTPLKLDKTSYGVKSDGILVGSIVGSHNGRIFMLGKEDGHVYEMDYSRNQVNRLICHTDQSLQSYLWFLPIKLKSNLDVKIKSIALDHERKAMYALSEKSTIQIFCLDDGHLTFAGGTVLTNIHDQFVQFLLSPYLQNTTHMPPPSTLDILGSTLAPRPFDLISIHPITKSMSSTLVFCAVTCHGCRLYFKADSSILTRQTTFTLSHVRLPPTPLTCFDRSLQLRGIFAAMGSNNKTCWVTSYQDQGHTIHEQGQWMDVLLLGAANNNNMGYYEQLDQTFYNTPQVKMVTLTKEGMIQIYKKQRPVDLVALHLLNGDTLDSCKERYGLVPTFAMVLDVLSSRKEETQVDWLIQLSKQEGNDALVLLYSRWVKDVWHDKELFRSDRYTRLVHCREGLEKLYDLVRLHPDFQPTVELLSTSIQVLALVAFLIQHPTFDSQGYKEKKSFADLVTTKAGHDSLKSLVTEAIHQVASHQEDEMISPFLVTHCPTLFTTCLYEADEYLARADQQQQQHLLLDMALEKYLTGTTDLSHKARDRVCQQFQALGYTSGVVTLTLQSNDKDDLAPILALFGDDDDNNVKVLELTLVAYPENKTLYHTIYTWLIDHDKLPLVFDNKTMTQYLVSYLESTPTESRLVWLYKYYDHQQQDKAAVKVLTQLATEMRDVTLDRRISYLRLALERSSSSLQLLYNVALIQQEIVEYSTDDRLVSRLLPLDDLLQDYAVPHGLWDQVLVLLHLQGDSNDDFDYMLMYQTWTRLLEQEKTVDGVVARCSRLGKRLYPSTTTFSIYLMVGMIEKRCKEIGGKEGDGFVVDLFISIGVGRAILLDAYEFLVSEQPDLANALDYLHSLS
ncbi:Nup133 N terminal like-domain-containing protein [Chlamydoabsidia padenii]|nr:Nup133 N terminal like-domain-containing protein [Chlamydoabsidia padenii]